MWKQKEVNKDKEAKLLSGDVGPLLARLLSQRNVEVDKFQDFLKADYNNLSHPHALNDVEKAVKIFCTYAKQDSKVGVCSDFDCDGITSASMIYELCKIFDLDCKVFLPSRFEHGYGLNSKSIQSIKDRWFKPPDLLFVLDCGTNNFKEIEELKQWGIKDIIIIDHHLVMSDELLSKNASALVSWHLSKNYNEMCACGEVFQFIRGIRWVTKKVDPIEFLTYAAVGTIADSSPIIGDNRIIVKHGLENYAMTHIRPTGLRSLMGIGNIKSFHLTQMDVSFKIAPRINAVGRIDKPDLVFKLMTEYDVNISEELADKVNCCNVERKKIQKSMENQAVECVKNSKFENGILIKDKSWHIGIIGIVASRIAEDFNKPTLILGTYEGKWRGSGRTVNGINIKNILDKCSFMFERYGGHAGAVGCVLKEEYIDTCAKIFDDTCKEFITAGKSDTYYDATLKIQAVKKENATELNEKLYPYCKDHNPEPIFKLSGVYVYGVEIKEGEGWKLMSFSVANKDDSVKYAFKCFSPKFGTEIEGEKFNVYFTFPQKWDDSDRFGQFELMVTDMERCE